MLHFVLKKHNDQEPSQDIYRTRGIYIERFILNLLFYKVFIKNIEIEIYRIFLIKCH